MSVDPAKLEIVTYPNPALRAAASPIESIDDTVRAGAARMLELMHRAEGAGLAAPQVGLPWRMFVTGGREEQPDRVYVNPRIDMHNGDLEVRPEGCLSLPGVTVDVRRPVTATITAQDLDGREFTLTASDLPARVWQHEIDHLDGILIIDKMSPMDRLASRRILKELEQKTRPGLIK
jgi:peptide deformylase